MIFLVGGGTYYSYNDEKVIGEKMTAAEVAASYNS